MNRVFPRRSHESFAAVTDGSWNIFRKEIYNIALVNALSTSNRVALSIIDPTLQIFRDVFLFLFVFLASENFGSTGSASSFKSEELSFTL